MNATHRLDGQSIVVTGGAGGIGYFIAEGLARRGARVILAARSVQKARTALSLLPDPSRHDAVILDLAAVDSICSAAARINSLGAIDGLVMNAGIIGAPSTRQPGPFGVESTVAVNVLAHMELLRLVLPALRRSPNARIVSTGSTLTKKIPFSLDNWLSDRSYQPRHAYAMSKHAAEILGFELARRLNSAGASIQSVVSHPGSAIDAVTPNRPPLHERPAAVRALAPVLAPVFSRIVQGKDVAAQPAITAISADKLPPEAYIGPSRGATGEPAFTTPVATSTDPVLGRVLWNNVEAILEAPIL